MIFLRGNAARTVLVVLTVAWAVACSSSKKTLLLVDVSLGANVPPPTTVSLTVTAAGSPLGSTAFSWSQAKQNILQAGIFLPDGVSGNVRVDAAGTGPSGNTAGFADNLPIVAGQTNGVFDVILLTVVGTPDAGTPDTGAPPEPDALGPDLANAEVARVPDAGRAEVLATDASGAEVALVTPDGGAPEVSAPDANGAEVALVAPDGGGEDSPVDGKAIDAPTDGPAIDAPSGGDAAPAPTDSASDADASPAPTWQAASNVENDVVSRSYYPAIAVEPIAENVYVAWLEDYAVKVKRWDRQNGTWGSTKTIEDRDLTASDVAIGADAMGHIILAWDMDRDTTLAGVWVSRADSSEAATWSPPVQVAKGTIFDLHLGVARNGVARLVYSSGPVTNTYWVYAAYFDGTSWTADPAPVLDPNSPDNPQTDSYPPVLAVGGTGDGVVLFDEYDANRNLSVAVVNLTGQSKTAPQILDTNTTEGIIHRTVAMNPGKDGSSNAAVVWGETSGLWASTYKHSGSWSSPQKIKGNADSVHVAAALDDNGLLTVAWAQSALNGGYNAMAIHEGVGGTWSDITPLETDNVSSYTDVTTMPYPKLAADEFGNVLAVWSKKVNDTTWGAYARRLQGTTSQWQPQVKLGQRPDLRAWNPVVAVADSGFAAASFVYYATSSDGTTTDTEAYNVEVAFCR